MDSVSAPLSAPPQIPVPPWTARRAWVLALRLLPRLLGRRLLHLECDTGELIGALHHLGLRAEGFDSDPAAIARARAQWPCARFHRCRLDEFRPETPFDLIYLSTAGRHWPGDRSAALELVERSLHPEGTVICDTQHLTEDAVGDIDAGFAAAGFELRSGFPRSSDDPWRVYRRTTAGVSATGQRASSGAARPWMN